MKTELLLVVMAGVVLSAFLIVGEVAAMRKRAKTIWAGLRHLYRSRNFPGLVLAVLFFAAFFLVQPVIIAFLVYLALDSVNPGFSHLVVEQIREIF